MDDDDGDDAISQCTRIIYRVYECVSVFKICHLSYLFHINLQRIPLVHALSRLLTFFRMMKNHSSDRDESYNWKVKS